MAQHLTYNRVLQILRDSCSGRETFLSKSTRMPSELKAFDPEPGTLFNQTFQHLDEFVNLPTGGAIFGLTSKTSRQGLTKKICQVLCQQLHDPVDHIERLDRAFSEFLYFEIFDGRVADPESLARETYRLLTRLVPDEQPYWELNAEATCNTLTGHFFHPGRPEKVPHRLKASTFFDRNIVCTAIHTVLEPLDETGSSLRLTGYIDLLAQLLQAALDIVPGGRVFTPGNLLVLRTFLWKSLQRSVTLYCWSLVKHGNREVWMDVTHRQTFHVQRFRRVIAAKRDQELLSELPAYLCPWAFELMRTHPAAAGVDPAYFIHLFSKHFGNLSARCIMNPDGSFRQCDGTGPFGCTRFTGAVIHDQSAHQESCDRKCAKLYWDEDSYRQVHGARAVRLEEPRKGLLQYCAASSSTMAISHVWSHGQGGRPERPRDGVPSTGFNSCLHQRYSTIARQMGCNSYWIDTACIPQDHQLRREAISQINDIFANSRSTLVCDRDIMMISIKKKTFAVLESLMAALLVCDWNSRAWTLLEGTRGAKVVNLLCKDNQTIELSEVIQAMYSRGRLSLAILCLTLDHLMGAAVVGGETFRLTERQHKYTETTAATLLSHRHASREGDEVVIWSLLCGRLVYTAEEFWRDAKHIKTGFLISDIPRLEGVPGFSWAPRRPGLASGGKIVARREYHQRRILEVMDSQAGSICADGLQATWSVCDMADVNFFSSLYQCFMHCIGALHSFGRIFWKMVLWKQLETALYYWQMACASLDMRRRFQLISHDVQAPMHRLALIRPSSSSDIYDGDAKEASMAVIEITGRGTWAWRKVIYWDNSVTLPPFRVKEITIE
ncbi:uncharacterized protein CIMG_07364 [Coccidioides immitis RS]|uniref:Heterokaryon incompatibility domain-containing protein n=1 Tax=Coccidioides immitis (strain RS) TaxID=246410 RepID=J3KA68_COCIM|nr:uncharacterized protein CIMG_07364 [Coccidioides immitis RS]EAS31885.3 hypothetical protein CIMG_07364 [Coccidioides immitis RS]TPX24565.1 hypothetical protein DIZ76_013913 [Coccidioides immitis]